MLRPWIRITSEPLAWGSSDIYFNLKYTYFFSKVKNKRKNSYCCNKCMIKNKAGSYRAQNLGLKWQERGLYRVQNGFRIVDISKHTSNAYHAKQIWSLFAVCVNLYFIGLISLNINNIISLKTKIIMYVVFKYEGPTPNSNQDMTVWRFGIKKNGKKLI